MTSETQALLERLESGGTSSDMFAIAREVRDTIETLTTRLAEVTQERDALRGVISRTSRQTNADDADRAIIVECVTRYLADRNKSAALTKADQEGTGR